MKTKLLILFGFLLTCIGLLAQNSHRNDISPGKHVELLVGKEITTFHSSEVLNINYGYQFYNDSTLLLKSNYFRSKKSKELKDKVFKVLSFKPHESETGHKNYILKIENAEIGVIYFVYEPYDPENKYFPFMIIGGVDFSDGYLCNDITVSNTKIANSSATTFMSPYTNDISFFRVFDNDKVYCTTMLINLRKELKVEQPEKTGVTILLDNGEKIEKTDAEIKSTISNSNNNYGPSISEVSLYANFNLTTDEIIKLTQYNIIEIKIFTIYNHKITDGNKLREYINCIAKKQPSDIHSVEK